MMGLNMLFPMLLLVLGVVEGSQYPASAPAQHQGWSNTPTQPSRYYTPSVSSKSVGTGRGYSAGGSGGWYTSAAGGGVRNYNNAPSGPAAMYYKNQRADKSTYNSIPVGRVPGNYYSRHTNSVHDPLRSRYGGYNLPVNVPAHQGNYGGYGSYRASGLYGNKALPYTSAPLNNHPLHRSQAFTGSKAIQHTNYSPTTKNTGVYVIPTPSKLYYDGVKD